mgnify:CR=1 FL=1
MKARLISYTLILFLFNVILIQAETINDLITKIKSQISKLNNRENLAEILKLGGLYDCYTKYCVHISLINSQYLDNQILKFPQIFPIDLGNSYIIVKIFYKYNFDENSKNYIAGVKAITDIVYFNLYSYENNIISLEPVSLISLGKNNLLVYLPLYINDSLKNKFLSISGQNPKSGVDNILNYDIFNPNSDIYSDLCSTITFSILPEDITSQESIKNLDITLEQRKKYYYPGNLQLCPNYCSYMGVDRSTISSICKCSLDYLETVEHKEYLGFNFNEKERFCLLRVPAYG